MFELVVHPVSVMRMKARFKFHHELKMFNNFNSHWRYVIIIIQALAIKTPSFFLNKIFLHTSISARTHGCLTDVTVALRDNLQTMMAHHHCLLNKQYRLRDYYLSRILIGIKMKTNLEKCSFFCLFC